MRSLTKLGVAAVVLSLGVAAKAELTLWQHCSCGPGDWLDEANWTAGAPTGIDQAYVANGGTAVLGGSGAVEALWLGHDTGDGTVQQTGGLLLVNTEVALGTWPGAHGTYELSGNGQLVSPSGRLWVGSQSYGHFKQTGGSVQLTTDLGVGGNLETAEPRVAVYELRNGQVVTTGRILVQGKSESVFEQWGGTVSPANIAVGNNGRYVVMGGSMSTQGGTSLNADGSASAQFIQDGGYLWMKTCGGGGGGGVSLGTGADTASTLFELRSGTLAINRLMLGTSGKNNVYRQSGGTASMATYRVGEVESGSGTAEILGGEMTVDMLYVGYRGSGELRQDGGVVKAPTALLIGFGGMAQGEYKMSGGTLAATGLIVGLQGKGTLNITDAAAQISVAGPFRFGTAGALQAVPGASIHLNNAGFAMLSQDDEAMAGLANLTLIVENTGVAPNELEVGGGDFGPGLQGFEKNFALGGLEVGGATSGGGAGFVRLVDKSINSKWIADFGPAQQALYVKQLVIAAGSTLDLNGLNLYTLDFQNLGGSVMGGSVQVVPEPGGVLVLAVAALTAALPRRALRATDGANGVEKKL